MTVQTEPEDFQGVVDALVARGEGPFILVAPTRDPCQPACTERLRQAKAHLIALAEDFTLGADGVFNPCRPIAVVLAPFRAAVLPEPKGDGSQRWSGSAVKSGVAAKTLGYPSGAALLKAVSSARIDEGDPLYILRQRGPGRTRSGRFYEDAVAHVAGLLEAAGPEYDAGVAQRREQARAAKAAASPADPAAAERRFMQALLRKEKGSR
jgi:hypothetical protein